MTVSASYFLQFAIPLSNGSTEIEWRNGASRAYYAGFHRALLSVSYCPDNSNYKMGDHERISERFKLEGSKKAKSIAYVLEAMKKHRRMADYEIDDPFFQHSAQNVVALYSQLEKHLNEFDMCFDGTAT